MLVFNIKNFLQSKITILFFSLVSILVVLSIIVYTITLIINYFINVKLFEKGVNID